MQTDMSLSLVINATTFLLSLAHIVSLGAWFTQMAAEKSIRNYKGFQQCKSQNKIIYKICTLIFLEGLFVDSPDLIAYSQNNYNTGLAHSPQNKEREAAELGPCLTTMTRNWTGGWRESVAVDRCWTNGR